MEKERKQEKGIVERRGAPSGRKRSRKSPPLPTVNLPTAQEEKGVVTAAGFRLLLLRPPPGKKRKKKGPSEVRVLVLDGRKEKKSDHNSFLFNSDF